MLAYAKNYLKNYAALRLFGPTAVQYPLLASYYVTHRCNLRCVYCSDGQGIPFHEHRTIECTLEQVTNILRRVFPSTPVLDITGGEPLMRADILEIIHSARNLGFQKVFLNTNGLLLDRFPGIIKMVDGLFVSLDSLDPETLTHIYRTNRKNIDRILDNISELSSSRLHANVVISAVLLPENLRHIPALMEFCGKHGFGFAVSPALKGTRADTDLMRSPDYQHCIDEIINRKNNGHVVLGSKRYFDIIRHFSPYQCYPLLMATIDPEGNVYLPCLEIADQKVSLCDYSNLSELLRAHHKNGHAVGDCRNGCHIFCHAGLSDMLENPLISLFEAYAVASHTSRSNKNRRTVSSFVGRTVQ